MLATAQGVTLNYQEEPLNDILLDLSDRYSVQISADPDVANRCLITINERYESMDEAMEALASRCELRVVNISGIYTFASPLPKEEPDKPIVKVQYLYQGQITEAGTQEPVPFALMQFGKKGITADAYGRFSFKSYKPTETGLFQSLGYETQSLNLNPGSNLIVPLKPALLDLGDVEVVADRNVLPITNIGEAAGHLRFNDIGNKLVPGLSDNLIFNNLRLYPGIMAAGEAITDFVIWGSYAGQNHVTYDGITLFSSWGINDDMGRVNPYMIRNVDVYKGAFNVPYGDRIGGSVPMEGTGGNLQNQEIKASVTNQLGNVYFNLPVVPGIASLQVAGRKTIFDGFDLSSGFDQIDNLLVPKYSYSDLNLKATVLLSENDRIELSGLYSEDSYSGRIQDELRRREIQDLDLSSMQSGASLKYARNWPSGGLSQVLASYSHYDPTSSANFFLELNGRPIGDSLLRFTWNNPIEETKIQLDHSFAADDLHQVSISAGYVRNDISLKTTTDFQLLQDTTQQVERATVFVRDQLSPHKSIKVDLGLKADMPLSTNRIWWQPRINLTADITSQWQARLGWGMYNQFISKNATVDEVGNRSETWEAADGSVLPVLKSMHTVAGISYAQKGLEVGLEGFFKHSEGFGRYTLNRRAEGIAFTEIESRAYGMELFARKRFKSHEFWTSYTLMQVEDRSATAIRGMQSLYRLAPQSQQHELKAVAVFNFSPFQFTLSSVYGSGFPNRSVFQELASFDIYRRTDLAAQYSFQLRNLRLDAGFSILNLFDQRNIRLNQSLNSPRGSLINTAGIPFTPTLFLNLGF